MAVFNRSTSRRARPVLAAALVCAAVLPPTFAAGRPAAPAGVDPLAAAAADLRAGRYERARKAADALARRAGRDARAAIVGARAERELGLLREARLRLEEASVRAPDDLPLRAELIRLAEAVGDRRTLKTLVDRCYEEWQAGRVDKTHAANLLAMAVAMRADNNWDDANDLLRSAVKADARDPEANLVWGETFLEKHAVANAEPSFREVLKVDPGHPDAHAGLARVLLEQGYDSAAAEREIAAALAVNPRHARALALRGEIALDAEDLDGVAAVVAQLRRTNPRDEGAAWLAAARALLAEDRAAYDREKRARLEVHPRDGEFFARVAEALVRHRRYDEARAVAAEGVALDETNAAALASLGLTLLRLGEESEGVATLRKAWDRDPYDARTYNLLELYEKVIARRYVTVRTQHLAFRVEPAARTAIEAIVGPWLEQVYQRFVDRYGFTPDGPITFELYGEPAHFAIRTVGLPRLGVTAVCFGKVITSQAPTNAAYNWGMVLAHELAHVFALQLSRSRVPRWFTEGLSELEAAHLRPEWRRRGELALAAALTADTLPPLERLSQAFVRARDPEAASTAYLHAAVAVEFLERRFGFEKIREALAAFGRGERLAPVLERLAGQPLATLERAFRAHLGERLAALGKQFLPAQAARLRPLADKPPGGPPRAIAEDGLLRLYAGDPRAARAALSRALLAPGGRQEPTTSFLAAELALAADDPAGAIEELQSLLGRGHDGYDVRLRLALASTRVGDRKAVEAHLRRAIALAPTQVEPRAILAELLGAQGRDAEKLAEEEQVLRLEPHTSTLAKRVVLEHARLGRPELVAELAAVALFIDPADADLHAALGRALAARDRQAEAIAAFERALRFAPADAAVHRSLAGLYERIGETRKAAAHRAQAGGGDAGLSAPSPRPAPRRAPPPAPVQPPPR